MGTGLLLPTVRSPYLSKFLLVSTDSEDWTTAWGYIGFLVHFKASNRRNQVLDSEAEVVGGKLRHFLDPPQSKSLCRPHVLGENRP